jgi:hypothetical protein
MRTFLSAHWKILVALVILILLAVVTMEQGAATPDPSLAARLRGHVVAIGAAERNADAPPQLDEAASYIDAALAAAGYRVQRQEYRSGTHKVRNLEASLSNLAPHARPARIFIVGAHYDCAPGASAANDNGSGIAAVLELARLLRDLRPSPGTELKFVFFVDEEPPWFMGADMGGTRQRGPRGLAQRDPDPGNFIAFVGTVESSALVRQALAAFRASSDFPAEGLAAPAYVQGVTLSNHSAYKRGGYPALMIADTAFLRYPYYQTRDDTSDRLDYDGLARVLTGLARTMTALAAAGRG